MSDLIEMVHFYANLGDRSSNPITIAGFHNLTPDLPMDQVIEYLNQVDPDDAEEAQERYSCFRKYEPNWFMYSGASHDQKLKCSDDIDFVYKNLIAQKDEFETVSTSNEFSFALLSAQLVAQYEEPYMVGEGSILFETANIRKVTTSIRWLVEEGGDDNKAILLADNISFADIAPSSSGFLVSLGHDLKNIYGDEMLIIGFAFNSGRVNARTFGMGNPILRQEVQPPPEGSFEWIAHNLRWPIFLLDLRGIDLNHPGVIWLDQPLYLHGVGEYYHEDDPEAYLFPFHIPTAFDAIIYIDEVSPSRLLPSADE
jgi:erythromycin esterase-like protein